MYGDFYWVQRVA
ncbi:Protein of unknown function [Bacillus wiedmannii]|nr:Protein of unknown function [Bacillus wiedmannii]